MISNKIRENRRGRPLKMPKNIERLYKEGKCSECSVVVTRMDFAKILGKFTKVKIQYESSSTPRSKKNTQQTSPNSNARLKSNENGMVLIHRNAYTQHPATDLLNSKKTKSNEKSSQFNNNISKAKISEASTPKANNILKENNRLKKTPGKRDTNFYVKSSIHSDIKKYGIIFLNPTINNNIESNNDSSLVELLPSIDKTILPSEDWCIDYLPKNGEPKEDKVYDRIAAELEDLMYNEKPTAKFESKAASSESKDDFPSIMDILNENTTENNQSIPAPQPNLESSDVEAMLLGKSNETNKDTEPTQMEVDPSVINNLMDVVQMTTAQEDATKLQSDANLIENPNSPSILDETLQKGIEEHLPKDSMLEKNETDIENATDSTLTQSNIKNYVTEQENKDQHVSSEIDISSVTHVVFKKCSNDVCIKSVTCPKNLKYSLELEGKSVEFLGAPKVISSLEDLKVLLQIVNETELHSLYVLH